jgi:hypothetical protein
MPEISTGDQLFNDNIMSYRVYIAPLYEETPHWWKTLLENHFNIHRVIEKYGGKINRDRGFVDYIEFESEAHFTFFLLSI